MTNRRRDTSTAFLRFVCTFFSALRRVGRVFWKSIAEPGVLRLLLRICSLASRYCSQGLSGFKLEKLPEEIKHTSPPRPAFDTPSARVNDVPNSRARGVAYGPENSISSAVMPSIAPPVPSAPSEAIPLQATNHTQASSISLSYSGWQPAVITEQVPDPVPAPPPPPHSLSSNSSSSSHSRSSAEEDPGSSIGPDFYELAPSEYERYSRHKTAVDQQMEYDIPSLKLVFSRGDCLPGWIPHLQAEGARYFSHDHDYFTIFTDADLYDPTMAPELANFVQQVVTRVETLMASSDFAVKDAFQPDKIDLVLDLTTSEREDGSIRHVCGYYFAHHDSRTVFWLDKFRYAHSRLWYSVNGVTSESHMLHEINAQYWFHCALFSCTRQPSLAVIIELRDILSHAFGDSLISNTTTVPYAIEDLQKMLALVDRAVAAHGDLQGYEPVSELGGLSRIVFILMSTFTRERLYHFHGEPAARLDRGISVYGIQPNQQKRALHFRMLSFLLFNAPLVYLEELEQIVADRLICVPVWEAFVARISREWTELTLYSTVLLNANIAFLAIPLVADFSDPSPVKIAAYLSSVSSFGSIVLGLLLLDHTRNVSSGLKTAPAAMGYLEERQSRLNGFGNLAIVYSLLYSLLMWGMLAFVAAFTTMCMYVPGAVTRSVFGSGWLAVALLTLMFAFVMSGKLFGHPIRGLLEMLATSLFKRKTRDDAHV